MDQGRTVRETLAFHHLPWRDFDELARGHVNPGIVRRLRKAERSRRLLLMRALVDEFSKMPELTGPFSSPHDAWDLLARAEMRSPKAFDALLAHPYTGSWAGYTIRLVHNQIAGVCPLWMHAGHLHAVAAAAAIRAGLNFEISVPVWDGGAILPTLGMVRLMADARYSIARVRGTDGRFEISTGGDRVVLPNPLDVDAPGWWAIRRSTCQAEGRTLSLSLDDVDPYRGLYEPYPPQRLEADDVSEWRRLLAEAWQLILRYAPAIARAIPAGLDSLVPWRRVPFRNPSASTGEAFGSALIARPADAAALASTLIHEFQHIVLGGVLHLTRMYGDDPRERFYAPWRDDPRPLGSTLQGVYAHFGVGEFWRALVRSDDPGLVRRAGFEFAYWRAQTWRTLGALRDDARLTSAGRRFVDGIAARLGPSLDEPVPEDLSTLADAIAMDHHAGWRIRHLRPDPHLVAELAHAWLDGRPRPPAIESIPEQAPTPVPDGPWSKARADLVRLAVGETDRTALARLGNVVPDATPADIAYASGRVIDALRGYTAELTRDPDRPASWIGLGLSLAATGTTLAARALLHHPELVRAVHRKLRGTAGTVPQPAELAAWIGLVTY